MANVVTLDFGNEARTELIRVLNEGYAPRPNYWVFYAVTAFCDGLVTNDVNEAADAVLAYFAPSGDERTDTRRRDNGYTITTNPYTIRRIILRRAS